MTPEEQAEFDAMKKQLADEKANNISEKSALTTKMNSIEMMLTEEREARQKVEKQVAIDKQVSAIKLKHNSFEYVDEMEKKTYLEGYSDGLNALKPESKLKKKGNASPPPPGVGDEEMVNTPKGMVKASELTIGRAQRFGHISKASAEGDL